MTTTWPKTSWFNLFITSDDLFISIEHAGTSQTTSKNSTCICWAVEQEVLHINKILMPCHIQQVMLLHGVGEFKKGLTPIWASSNSIHTLVKTVASGITNKDPSKMYQLHYEAQVNSIEGLETCYFTYRYKPQYEVFYDTWLQMSSTFRHIILYNPLVNF